MAEEIGFENGRNSNFQGLVTLTLDPAIQHTVVHHSSTSTYIPNFNWNRRNFLWTDGRTYGWTDVGTYGRTFPPSNSIRSTFGSRPKKRSERRKHCTCAGCSKVRTPPARPPQTHRQDRLQYIAPLASAQCKYREYCVNSAKHNIPVFDVMFSSSSSLQKCTKTHFT